MAVSEQFKRCVVAVFDRENVKAANDLERAVAAFDICKTHLVKNKYLSFDSIRKEPKRMKETGKGRKASRAKKSDGTHSSKMHKYSRIWELYMEARSRGMT